METASSAATTLRENWHKEEKSLCDDRDAGKFYNLAFAPFKVNQAKKLVLVSSNKKSTSP